MSVLRKRLPKVETFRENSKKIRKKSKIRKRKFLPSRSSQRTAPAGPRRSHCLVRYRTLAESAQKRTPPQAARALTAEGAGCLRGGAPHRSRRLRTTTHPITTSPPPSPLQIRPQIPIFSFSTKSHSHTPYLPPSHPFQPNSPAHFFRPLTCPTQPPINRLIALPRSPDIRPQSPARELPRPLAPYISPILHFCRSRLVATSILHLFYNVNPPCTLVSAKVQHRETYLFCPMPPSPAATRFHWNLVPYTCLVSLWQQFRVTSMHTETSPFSSYCRFGTSLLQAPERYDKMRLVKIRHVTLICRAILR